MEKRVDRNKALYDQIDKMIIDKKKNLENSSFDNAQSALSSVNPYLFGNNVDSKESKPKKKVNKVVIISILAIVVILLIVLAVIIL